MTPEMSVKIDNKLQTDIKYAPFFKQMFELL